MTKSKLDWKHGRQVLVDEPHGRGSAQHPGPAQQGPLFEALREGDQTQVRRLRRVCQFRSLGHLAHKKPVGAM